MLTVSKTFCLILCLVMPRFTQHGGSAAAVLKYYLGQYYDAGAAFDGRWLDSKGAELLGLHGQVESEQLKRLLNNRHPFDNTKLTPRDKDNRRLGYDVTFAAPKSVSIAFGLNNDLDLVDAIRDATNDTLLQMEQDVTKRVNPAPGVLHHVKSNNFIAGVWIHPEARGVDGQVPDVQLHSHGWLANATFDVDKNRWLAADFSKLVADSGYYESIFMNKLAKRVQDLGYPIERTEHNFEIVGIDRPFRDKFSKRSHQIHKEIAKGEAEDLAARYGISMDEAKDWIGGRSRDPKDKNWSLDELQKRWQAQLTPQESHQLDLVEQSKSAPSAPAEQPITAKDAVDFALSHHFEKEAAERERKVLGTAIKYGIENNTAEDIKAELARRDLVRQGKDEEAILTTKELQQQELDILNFAKHGKGSMKPIDPNHQIEREWLSDEQKQAVTGLLASSDQLQILRGVAGVGKTTLLEEVVPAIKAQGKAVAMMAPTQRATGNLITDGFSDATTLQRFLVDEKLQEQVKGGVIIVDEAGLVANPEFRALTRIAENQQAHIVAVGDSRQHQPVGRGAPMKLIEKFAGIKPKEVTTIRRQSGRYKTAAEHFSRHEIAEGLAIIQELEWMHEIADDEARNAALADDYVEALEQYDPKELLVVAATHAERNHITDVLRSKLKEAGIINKDDETEFTTYLPKQHLSAAMRQDTLQYQVGDKVAFHRNVQGGFNSGDQLTVTKVTKDKVFAGQQELPLEAAESFNVFRPEISSYATGDVIRLTRNRNASKGKKTLRNGSLHTIRAIRDGVITLDNGEKLGEDFRFYDHGIAVTSVISQGSNVKRAFISASSLAFPATSPEATYVSGTRAKKKLDVYTNSTDALLRAASRYRPKPLATEVKPETQTASNPRRRPQLGKRFNRIKEVAQAYATKQLRRFGEWLQPGKHMEPEMGR